MTDTVQDTEVVAEDVERPFPKVREKFYLVAITKLNGSIDVESEGQEPRTLTDALAHAVDRVEEYGDTWYVIECRAIKRIVGRKPSIQTIKRR